MEETKRSPQQKRSIQTKETILAVSKSLFCQKGFYNTTTNEIAKTAHMSIGSLYSYFADKDAILSELLERSNNSHFLAVFDDLQSQSSTQLYKQEPRKWLTGLVESLIKAHEAEKDFLRELNVLYYAKPEVKATMDMQSEKIRAATYEFMKQFQSSIQYKDLEAASTVMVDFIKALVDRIVFHELEVDNERIRNAGIEVLCQFISR